MKKLTVLFISGIALMMAFSLPVIAYDQLLAQSYEHYFAPFKGKATGKAMQQMPVAAFVKAVRSGAAVEVIDIRTPAESALIGFTIPGTMILPMDQIFKPENLARISRDKKVVVSCKAGHRGMAVTTALRHLGFNNVYNLKGGTMALMKHLNPKTACVE